MVNLKSAIGQLQEKLTALLKQYAHLEKENQVSYTTPTFAVDSPAKIFVTLLYS